MTRFWQENFLIQDWVLIWIITVCFPMYLKECITNFIVSNGFDLALPVSYHVSLNLCFHFYHLYVAYTCLACFKIFTSFFLQCLYRKRCTDILYVFNHDSKFGHFIKDYINSLHNYIIQAKENVHTC